MKKIYYFLLAITLFAAMSCSKSSKKGTDTGTSTNPTGPSKTGSTLDLIKDSVYLYTKEENLWYDQMPTYEKFQPRSFADAEDAKALTKEVDALSQYPINPATGKAYEYYADDPGEAKYSFIDDGSVSGELGGTNGDFGFEFQWDDVNDIRVIYVYPGSPADIKGIKRGDRITSVNGRTNISYDQGQYGDGSSNNVNFVVAAIENSNTVSLVLTAPSGTLTINNMAVANYTINPVLLTKIITADNGAKVGYLVFNVFTDLSNAQSKLDAAFSTFTAAGITDLIVDLRYNGGGAVETAEYLDNLIAPPSVSGSNMYTAYYNSQLQKDIYPLLASQYDIPSGYFKPTYPLNHVNFSKKGSLNINRVFFIMTGSTASASELTINNLRPHMDVEFIGNTSYGKPVGFFAIDINKYQLYTPEFATENSANVGGYYNGFTPGDPSYHGAYSYDDETTDFGDPNENLLSIALGYINTGKYPAPSSLSVQSLAKTHTFSINDQRAAALMVNKHKFKGMVLKSKLQLKSLPKK